METSSLIRFPRTKGRPIKQRRPRNVDGIEYFSPSQIKLIRRTARDQAELDHEKGNVTAIREWMAVDLLTSTGLRVSEAANIRCGDFKTGYGESAVFVRDGKGSISGHVIIPESLKKHFKSFLKWKQDHGEPTDPDDYIFIGQRGPWTSQALQQIVKKYLKQLGLYECGKSAHSLRHSYAVELYSREKDLRAVQKTTSACVYSVDVGLRRCHQGTDSRTGKRIIGMMEKKESQAAKGDREKALLEIEQKISVHRLGNKAQKTNVGVLLDVLLWKQFKLSCLEEGVKAGEKLEELISGYLKRR
jgi:integrase/recombinase XerD